MKYFTKKRTRKITKKQFALALAFAAFSSSMWAANSTVTITPESYHYMLTERNFNAKVHFHVSICNPTGDAIQGSYSTTVYAQKFEHNMAQFGETVTVAANSCFTKDFDSSVAVSYWQTGSYRLTGAASATGVDSSQNEQYGWIGVGMY